MKSSLHSLNGSAQLLLDVIGGTVNLVEQTHTAIAQKINARLRAFEGANQIKDTSEVTDAKNASVIANTSYAAIRSLKNGLKRGLQASVDNLSFPAQENASTGSSKAKAALNGICGDHLQASNNSLAIQMHMRSGSVALQLGVASLDSALPDATPHIVVMIHGLCLSHEFWCRPATKNLCEDLIQTHNYTAIQLSYNTGLHISTNGRALAQQLEELVHAWPVKVKTLSLIGHSMGGLVIRSAAWYAEQNQAKWLDQFRHAVYAGSPHHGSALAKAGHWLTAAMRASKYARPYALGRHTSHGIKDLRHGNLIEEDWRGIDQDEFTPDNRNPIPLSPHAKHYFIAASVGKDTDDLNSMMVGDWLVRLGSATGQHRDEEKKLNVDAENCRIFHGVNHFDLLDSKHVHEQIVAWLN